MSKIRRPEAVLAAIVVAGAAMRFAGLGVQGFWIDEVITADRVLNGSFGHMLSAVADTESTPPLYYVLAWVWSQVFGLGEAGVRSFSALVGVATIPVAYLAARELVSSKAALWTAAFVALSPWMVWYSQEARAYALLALLGAASLLFFARALHTRPGRPLLWWALSAAAVVATHYYGALLVGVEALLLLAALRAPVLPAVAGVAAVAGALVPLAIAQDSGGRTSFIAGQPLSGRITQLNKQFLSGEFGGPVHGTTTALAILALGGLALLVLRAPPEERRGGLVAVALGAGTIALGLVLALAGIDFFFPRNLIGAWLPLAIAGAAGFASVRFGWVPAAGLAVVLAGLSVGFQRDDRFQRERWDTLAAALGPAGDRAIVLSPGFAEPALAHYLPGVRPLAPGARVRRIVLVATRDGGGPVQVHPLVVPGFRESGRRELQKFSIVTYESARPVVVDPRELAAGALGYQPPIVLGG